MTDTNRRYTQADLLGEMERAWTELNAALDAMPQEQMTGIKDPQGWTVKDHLIHLTAWERSVIFFLQGKRRHEGLGVEEEVFGKGDDAINAVVHDQCKDTPLDEVWADFRETHRQLLNLVEGMGDDDLYKANSDFQSEVTGERDERPVVGMIYSNSAGHFREHQGWIESLVAST